MDPCTGRWRLQIFWIHLRPGCCWIIFIMLNGFPGSGWRCIWRNVQARFGRRGKMKGEATIDWRRIWVTTWATWREVTSPSCQKQCSRLWLAGCGIVRIWFCPANNSKPFIRMWGTGNSWLISSTKTEVRKSHSLWHWCSSAPWSRTNRRKSIWDYVQMGKW